MNEDLFRKSYGFLEEMKHKEKKMVQRAARKSKDPARKDQLERLLQQMVCVRVFDVRAVWCSSSVVCTIGTLSRTEVAI